MIKFMPNEAQLVLTNDQLYTVTRLTGSHDAEVVDHEHTQRVTLYVNHGDHEIRFEIEVDGGISGVERGVEIDQDWEWTPEDFDPHQEGAEVLHEAVETIGKDKFECGIIRINNDRQPVAYCQLGETTVSISRSEGRVSIEVDDIAEEDVYMSVNLQTLTAKEDDYERVPWNGRR